jgi:hypothetical protein
MLAAEARDLMAEPPAPWETLPAPVGFRIESTWKPIDAKNAFDNKARALGLRSRELGFQR